ncbi:carbon-nitrogen hydrolase [Saccharibacillus sp. O23]|uniref:carbon-nitrogen family hydrolase n=1 Tax=Saccharibacillus sp. O23 TaxID=2009338 RepID=UPI000B4DF2A6|nr:carbon-nitrogen family hydrolase [Saccharibacillus sp. O23]OWR31000.1 carbon-nitrogen hydrolase [Saccharibacillus sp. O23]
MTKRKITCIQHNIVFGDPERNYAAMEASIARATQNKPDIVVLPELWTTGYDLTRLDEIADEEASRTRAFLAAAARKYGVDLVGGSAAERTPQGVFNTLLVYDREGRPCGAYSKAHLFRLMDEHLHLKAGDRKGRFELSGLRSAGAICYDIRFPEWIRANMADGAEVLFVTAEWPLERLHHWRTLLIARAIENQCWVVACNRSGRDPDHVFAGHSLIVGPWGDVLAEAGEEDEFLTAEIDTEEVARARGRIPVFEDRRPDLYR